MKIEITKNERDMIAQMIGRVNQAASRLSAAKEVHEVAQASFNDFVSCKALDGGGATNTRFDRVVTTEEDGKFFLTLCEPEKQV